VRSDQILARTTQRLDELALLEQGRKVERGLYDENTGNEMLTDQERLSSLLMGRLAAGKTFATWTENRDRVVNLGARSNYTPFNHDLDCDCKACNAAWRRLFSDLLPRRYRVGKP